MSRCILAATRKPYRLDKAPSLGLRAGMFARHYIADRSPTRGNATWLSRGPVRETVMNAAMRMTFYTTLAVGLPALSVFAIRSALSPGCFEEMIHRGEEIQRLEQLTLRHQKGIRQAVREYIAQRGTLAETMQRLKEREQELAQEWPAYSIHLKQQPQPVSDEMRYYSGQ